jgi:hypothetical protein
MRRIIGLVGFIGSGKGTVGDYLSMHGYTSVSFAGSLKDALSAIFGWDRDLLEGVTADSRRWREEPDAYWSKKMGKPITPRWAMQNFGTEVMRNHFFTDIWVASLENKIQNISGNTVITDARFPNEIQMIRENGGELWWVNRDELPQWYQCALRSPNLMPTSWPSVHGSEYLWINQGPFVKLDNNLDLEHLYRQVDNLL